MAARDETSTRYAFVIAKLRRGTTLQAIQQTVEETPKVPAAKVTAYLDTRVRTLVYEVEHRATDLQLGRFHEWAVSEGFDFRESSHWSSQELVDFVKRLRPFHWRRGKTPEHKEAQDIGKVFAESLRRGPKQDWESEGTFSFRVPQAEPRTSDVAPAQHGAIKTRSPSELARTADVPTTVDISQSMRIDLGQLGYDDDEVSNPGLDEAGSLDELLSDTE